VCETVTTTLRGRRLYPDLWVATEATVAALVEGTVLTDLVVAAAAGLADSFLT
jgi:hypothetical protein